MSRTIDSIEINSLSYKELRTLMNNQPAEHLEEVPFGDYKLKIDLCDEVYNYSEITGHLRCYAVHSSGQLAGYMVVMASEMIHHKSTMQAVTDVFYIAPEYRNSGAFVKLLDYVEADLKSNNIRFFTVGLNPNMPHFSRVDYKMSELGYISTEVSVTKEL